MLLVQKNKDAFGANLPLQALPWHRTTSGLSTRSWARRWKDPKQLQALQDTHALAEGVEFDQTEKKQHALIRLTCKSGKWFLSNPRSPRIKGREVSTQRSPKHKSRSCRLSSGHVTCSRTHEHSFLFAIPLQKGSTKAAGSRSSLTLHIKQSETSVN